MAKKKETIVPPEWSYPIQTEEISDKVRRYSISPNEEERALLAKRLDVVSVDTLEAKLEVVRNKGSMIVHVTGVLKARITQTCVVTTAPVVSDIEEEFRGWYADPAQAVSFAKARRDKQIEAGQNELPVLSEADDPEPIIDGQIDLGELTTQYLSLFIDPYPRAEGVEYGGENAESQKSPEIRPNPFAALAAWKDKQGGGDA